MKRTPLAEREMPSYTKSEEIMNSVTHIFGAVTGIAVLVLCLIITIPKSDVWAIASSAFYGFSMIALYTVSSVYHGLPMGMGKRVMRVVDHCTIFFLIAGTYAPILLAGIRPSHSALAWVIFASEFTLAILGAALNAIDLKKFKVFSMICYLVMGWLIVFSIGEAIEAMTDTGFWWLLSGGIAFTVGAVLYVIGKKKRYIHSVFHVFVVIGTVLQAVSVIFYVL